MAEPRARPRTKGQVFSTQDLSELLYAYGDNPSPRSAPNTVAALDEILTDFIIETCHVAALSASYSRRQKIKVDDFKFVLRSDEQLLGRVLEQLYREKVMREARKVVDFDKMAEGGGAAMAVGDLEGIAEMGGAKEEMKKKGKRGRKRKAEKDAEEKDAKSVAQ